MDKSVDPLLPWSPSWRADWSLGSKWMNDKGLATDSTLFHTTASYHPNVCHACKRTSNAAFHLQVEKLLVCTACKIVRYCSAEHQKSNWKYHKTFCKAISRYRKANPDFSNKMEAPKSKDEYRNLLLSSFQAIERLAGPCSGFSANEEGRLTYFIQSHCESCYTTTGLHPCRGCSTIAYCTDCLPSAKATGKSEELAKFYDHVGCDDFFLILACYAMIGEMETPLACSSDTVCTLAQASLPPSNWNEYLDVKRGDFELPEPMFNYAPVAAMLTDSLSLQLSALSALHLVYGTAILLEMSSLSITFLGASGSELGPNPYAIFRELLNWLPNCRTLKVRMIGPDVIIPLYGNPGRRAYRSSAASDGRTASIEEVTGFYHHVIPVAEDGATDLFVAQHSGIHSPEYTEGWRPTLERVRESMVPALFTCYNAQEMVDDSNLLVGLGFEDVACGANPLRSTRPNLEPSIVSGEGETYYFNAATVLVKGIKAK